MAQRSRHLRWRPRAISAVAVLVVALAVGCQIGPDDEPAAPGADAAQLLVTADHGREELLRTSVSPGRSVLRTLQSETDVATAFGGGFVNEMFERRSDGAGARDWFYFVDGLLSAVGARQHTVSTGQSIWWDFRTWSAVRDPWAVVGAWPAPFAGREVSADPPLRSALTLAGATAVDESAWRVRVGAEEDLERREPSWRRAADRPGQAGLAAVMDDGRIRAVSRSGDAYVPVANGVALAATVPTGADHTKGVLMVVVGRRAVDAERAARRILDQPTVLEDRYAVVFDRTGEPIFAAGQGPL